jgi:NAD(P)-dependent dehydrogenase (short-subunit alcohol dehydrogenase family)
MSTQVLAGKAALVTGASRGIGRATARRLAKDGAFVLVHYGAAEAEAHSLVDEIKSSGGRAIALQADLSDAQQVVRLAGDVRHALKEHVGSERLDILVNNAGVAPFVPFAQTDDATLERILAVNVKAPYRLTALLADTLPEGGRVIFTTTAVTKTAFPGIAAYAASKGAIDTLILHLAAELGAKGVRVTGVAPGAIETDMSAWLNSPEGKAQAHSIQALQRIGKPEDIANVIAFLAGPDGDWVTGTIVTASGGTKL